MVRGVGRGIEREIVWGRDERRERRRWSRMGRERERLMGGEREGEGEREWERRMGN